MHRIAVACGKLGIVVTQISFCFFETYGVIMMVFSSGLGIFVGLILTGIGSTCLPLPDETDL
jgi:hypothetical protein